MSILNGWHPGELIVHHKLGHESDHSIMSQYRYIDCDLPGDHATFHSTRLPFVPITTLDSAGRPWGSILAGKDGKPGFIQNSRYSVLEVEANVWPGDPLLHTADMFEKGGEMLVAGIGIEFPTRRRNKFAGKVTKLERHGETIRMDWTVNEAIGNCPKYINMRSLIPHPTTSPKITYNHPTLAPSDRLPAPLISFILAADTVFIGTTYAASLSSAPEFPSHVGMNQRGGLPGFVRVLPSDARTLVLPDYSGNRFMTSLGNIEATPLAALTVVSFTTGAILYLTGTATNHFGVPATEIMPFQQRLTTLHIDGYVFVEDALPVRQSPGSSVERSAYSPPVRLLAEEIAAGGGTPLVPRPGGGDMQALLVGVRPHTSSIATFTWELVSPNADGESPPSVAVHPGQAAVLDFTPLLGQAAYQHMAPLNPRSVNDDRIRTWSVSSSSTWASPSSHQGTRISLTMREKPDGLVTGALFTLVKKLMSVGRADLLEDMGPLGVKVGFVGVSGEFILPEEEGREGEGEGVSGGKERKILWVAGGIGITPFLGMLNGLASSSQGTVASWDIRLVLSTREPEAMVRLVEEAVAGLRRANLRAGVEMRVKLELDVFSHEAIPDLHLQGAGEDDESNGEGGGVRVEVRLRTHRGRLGRPFFEELAKVDGEGVERGEREVYVCGPGEFEGVVVEALGEGGRVRREGFGY